MARVEQADIRTSLGASLGGVLTDVSGSRVGAGLTQIGTALDRLGDESNRAVAVVARGFNQRANERVFLEAQQNYWEFETDLLRGKDGILLRRAEDFEGATEEASRRITEHVREFSKKMPTGPGRDAFLEFASKELASTRNRVAATEAEQLEGLRVSRASAALTTRMEKTVIEAPDRFLPQMRPDGTQAYADPELITEIERNLEMVNRGADDAEISVKARELIAEGALKSVFAQLDLAPNRIPVARQIQDAYESLWTPTQREAVSKRIVDEAAYSSMDEIVAGSYAAVLAQDANPSEKALRDHAAASFKARFKSEHGYDAPDDMVQMVKSRASTDMALRLDEDKKAHDNLRGAQQTEIIKALGTGNKAKAIQLINEGLEDASGEKDTDFAAWLLRAQENVLDSGSVSPKETTPQGELLMLRPAIELTQPEIMRAQTEMSPAHFRAWAGPALGQGGTTPSSAELGVALDNARARVEGKPPYEKTPKRDTQGVYAKKHRQMMDLSQRFFEQNGKLPSPTELDDIATSLHLSTKDTTNVLGFAGSLGDLLADPKESKLSHKEPRDRVLLAAAANIAANNPRIAMIVERELDLPRGKRAGNLTAADMEKDPELVARILELGLLLNLPMQPDIEGREPQRFRDEAARIAEVQE